jgi:hypothetical protein
MRPERGDIPEDSLVLTPLLLDDEAEVASM